MDLVERAIPIGTGIKSSSIISKVVGWYGGGDVAGRKVTAIVEYEVLKNGTAFIVAKTDKKTTYGSMNISDFSILVNDEEIGMEENVMYSVKVNEGDVIKATAKFTADSNTSSNHMATGILEMAVSI